MWGTVGILYNTEMVTEEVDSWDILWNEKYDNQIIMQNSIRDCLAVALVRNGYSINTRNTDELQKAKQDLIAQKKLVYAYYVDETKEVMANNGAALAVVWSGDAAYAIEKNDKLAYALPKEGTNFWFDSLVIPKNAPNYELAMKFVDFMCRPEIAKMNLEYIYYSTPNEGAVDLLDEEYTSDEVIFPDMNYVNTKCEIFKDLGDDLDYLDQDCGNRHHFVLFRYRGPTHNLG
jgi:spermidine/putrescine transport system substrate-binding protein